MTLKPLSLLFLSLVILTSTIPEEAVSQVHGIVILVSDNEADLTLAEKVAEILNAELVVTPWGLYSESVVDDILEKDPSFVMIIGGPKAVVPEYEKFLENLGIPKTRIWGETRVETSRAVVQYLLKDYPSIFKRANIVIIHGWDLPAIVKAKQMKYSIPIFVSQNVTDIPTIPSNKTIIIESPYSMAIMVRFRKYLQNVTYIKAEITPAIANEAIERAEIIIKRAEKMLEEPSPKLPSSISLLDQAKRLLEMAKLKFESDNYQEAYILSLRAKLLAEKAIVLSQMSPKAPGIEIQIELRMLQIVASRLEKLGYDVSEVKALLNKAQEALKAGKISETIQYMNKAKEKLREIRTHQWRRRR
ncbi:MAG: hypothetical protein PWP39_163 [Pyrococcus sp.]|uniref:cell wall-binding repeat-containing protein n=1 Tax=Pyrococcus sp. TaxID=33866 RepID=UPI00258CE26F|nr:cell wall-binding repeat-containing protein [Pyrococcus sp.]MDK2868928.1 hypothetical protein [Pyrococcus sp.]